MEYFVNWQVPMWDNFIRVRKVLGGVPLNAKVSVISTVDDMVQVDYGKYRGWIESKYIEPYQHALPYDVVDLSDIETPEQNDAKQYVNWGGYKQVNMCGEICVAHIAGVKLSNVLTNWKARKLSLYNRIFGGGKATGTGPADLIQLLDIYGMKGEMLDSKIKKYTEYSFDRLLDDYHVIASCNMDSVTGALRGSGVGHWVEVTNITPDRAGFGWIEVFNPFNNCYEIYSWREWLATSRNYPYGVIVRRQQNGG